MNGYYGYPMQQSGYPAMPGGQGSPYMNAGGYPAANYSYGGAAPYSNMGGGYQNYPAANGYQPNGYQQGGMPYAMGGNPAYAVSNGYPISPAYTQGSSPYGNNGYPSYGNGYGQMSQQNFNNYGNITINNNVYYNGMTGNTIQGDVMQQPMMGQPMMGGYQQGYPAAMGYPGQMGQQQQQMGGNFNEQMYGQMMQCMTMAMSMMSTMLQFMMGKMQQQPGGTAPGTGQPGQTDTTKAIPKVDFKNDTSIQNGMKQLVGTGPSASIYASLMKAKPDSPEAQKLYVQLTQQMTKDGKSDQQIKALGLLYTFSHQKTTTGTLQKMLKNAKKGSAEYKKLETELKALEAGQAKILKEYQGLATPATTATTAV